MVKYLTRDGKFGNIKYENDNQYQIHIWIWEVL